MHPEDLSPDIYGIETEYSGIIEGPYGQVRELVGSCHSPDVELGLYVEPENKGSSHIHQQQLEEAIRSCGINPYRRGMLSNGGRLYIDPSGPEYCTPETRTAEEAVIRSFEGDDLVRAVLRHLTREGVIGDSQLNRKVVDHNRTSRGIHLNTTTTIHKDPCSRTVGKTAALNVAKGAMFGSGGLLVDENGQTSYHHSPRLSITSEYSAAYADYKLRPLVRLPFKEDYGSLRRVETVTSDALNFGWPLRASLVATNALFRIIELGHEDLLPELSHPVRAAQEVGEKGYKARISAVNHQGEARMIGPLDMLRELCEVAYMIDAIEGTLDEESDQVLTEIIEVADTLQRDEEAAADRVESVMRWRSIQKKMESSGAKIGSDIICRVDYGWDWLDERGYAKQLRDKDYGWHGFKTRPRTSIYSQVAVEPPVDSRATARVAALQAGLTVSDWHSVSTGLGEYQLNPSNPQLPDEVLDYIGASAAH